jgi:ferritin
MKDLVRLKTSLTEDMAQILNKQIKIESTSAAKYLAMASWCAENGYENATTFFVEQAGEERSHMFKIFNYVIGRGGKAMSPEVTDIPHEFSSLREVCETALEQEISVSNSINLVVEAARKNNDYATDNFMQWFVSEQVEEEAIARRIVELFDIIGEDGVGLFTIDKQIGQVRAAHGA